MVELIAITKPVGKVKELSSQELLTYIARISNPSNQMNLETAPKLIKYLVKHKHISPLEHAFMTMEIETSRAIATQMLRHRSFVFQEFSQRYSKSDSFVKSKARRQDMKNRQNSLDDLSENTVEWWSNVQDQVWNVCNGLYEDALDKGIAKECARMVLPLNTKTRLYMTGNVRSWIYYCELRCDPSTQLEHRNIANECKKILIEQFPDVASALEWI